MYSTGTIIKFTRLSEKIDLYTGIILKCRTIKEVPVPNKVVGHMKYWGDNSKSTYNGKNLQFLSIIKEEYDWYNDELEEFKGHIEYEVPHPDIP